jgi:hypothetical protein
MTDEHHKLMVGIFWRVDSVIIVDAVSQEKAEPYGDAIQYSGHYDFHEAFVPDTKHDYRFKVHDYDYYPRGRVVFFPNKNRFVLYADSCLTSDDIQMVISLFGLDGQVVQVAEDEHYRCAACNKAYME